MLPKDLKEFWKAQEDAREEARANMVMTVFMALNLKRRDDLPDWNGVFTEQILPEINRLRALDAKTVAPELARPYVATCPLCRHVPAVSPSAMEARCKNDACWMPGSWIPIEDWNNRAPAQEPKT